MGDMARHGAHWNTQKMHCKHGHEFTPENTYVYRGGRRQCKTCIKLRKREHRQRNISK